MKITFWRICAIVAVCAAILSAAVYNGITIGTGETFDASAAAVSKPFVQSSSTPGSCTGTGWLENTTTHDLFHCESSVFVKKSTDARPIGWAFDGAGTALTSGATGYWPNPYACTIQAWTITVNAGTATVDVWKIAAGSAHPTITDTITASAVPAIASGTNLKSTTLTGWTTAVAKDDIFGFNLSSVATANFVSIMLECKP